MKKSLFGLLITSIALAGCTIGGGTTPQTGTPPATSPTTATSPSTSQAYSLEEIAQHSTPNNCWFAVDGAVYNVTPYIADGKHPGGAEILKGCGKDATDLFHTQGGKGEDHSAMAQNYLKTFQVGVLK